MPAYKTIASPACTEIPAIKKSRFVANAAPVTSETEAMTFVASVRARHKDARHHCFAWRLQAGDAGWRTSDDGEPGGTAGMPILARIDGEDLRCLVVVVTRWFGGTKLGKGGLIRAYGSAAAAVLQAAEITEVRDTVNVQITMSYQDHGSVEGVLRGMGLESGESTYGEAITLKVAVPVEDETRLGQSLKDATAGRVDVCRPPHTNPPVV